MENPQSLEEVLHELEWLIKSEADTKPQTNSDDKYSQAENINFADNISDSSESE